MNWLNDILFAAIGLAIFFYGFVQGRSLGRKEFQEETSPLLQEKVETISTLRRDIFTLCSHLEICLCKVADRHTEVKINTHAEIERVCQLPWGTRDPYAIEMLERRQKQIGKEFQFETDANKALEAIAERNRVPLSS